MKGLLLSLLCAAPFSMLAQTGTADLPAVPLPSSASLTLATEGANPGLFQAQVAPPNQQQPLINPATTTISMTRTDAERLGPSGEKQWTAAIRIARLGIALKLKPWSSRMRQGSAGHLPWNCWFDAIKPNHAEDRPR